MVPEGVVRPGSADEVADSIRQAAAARSTVTPAGSQTSMTGSSITDRGVLMSLSGMNRIIEVDPERRLARVEPGVRIGELNRAAAEHDLLFAPDPTSEEDATIGGAIACNASGARTFYYGPTRNHINAVRVVHADGESSWYRRERLEKNCVGYSMVQDPVDWFIGSEGTLGVIVEAELSLVTRPLDPVGLAIPFRDLDAALGFVVAARETSKSRARCLELFDEGSLEIASSFAKREWHSSALALVYLEDDAGSTGNVDVVLENWLEIAEECGAISEDIRVYHGATDLRDARRMRHSVPSMMNERGARYRSSGGRKISTDWAVPYRKLGEALRESSLAIANHGAPPPITYGHAGNGHPHQNFIAEDAGALERIEAAVEETLKRVIALGGTVSAEHGLGKLKRRWIHLQLSARQMTVMRHLKQALDPDGILSPGNILD
jgi:FAD/FMN-containing dehydrogenase